MGTFQVMDASGHSTHSFDPKDKIAVAEAARRFAELLAQGYTAAERAGKGEATVTRTLNPDAETVFYPRLKGG